MGEGYINGARAFGLGPALRVPAPTRPRWRRCYASGSAAADRQLRTIARRSRRAGRAGAHQRGHQSAWPAGVPHRRRRADQVRQELLHQRVRAPAEAAADRRHAMDDHRHPSALRRAEAGAERRVVPVLFYRGMARSRQRRPAHPRADAAFGPGLRAGYCSTATSKR